MIENEEYILNDVEFWNGVYSNILTILPGFTASVTFMVLFITCIFGEMSLLLCCYCLKYWTENPIMKRKKSETKKSTKQKKN